MKKKDYIKLSDLRIGMIIEGRITKAADYVLGRKATSVKARFMVTRTMGAFGNLYQFESCDRKSRRHWIDGSSRELIVDGKIVGRAAVLRQGSPTTFRILLDSETGIIRAGCEYIDCRDVMKKAAKAMGYKLVKETA